MATFTQHRTPYDSAQKSPYRARLAHLAKPLGEETQKRIQVAKHGVSGYGALYANSLVVDLPRLLESIDRGTAIMEELGLPEGTARDRTGFTTLKEFYYDKGVCLDFDQDNEPFVGAIVRRQHMREVEVMTVVADSPTRTTTIYSPEVKEGEASIDARILINAVQALESAAYKINLYRHLQLEPEISCLFHRAEEVSFGEVERRLKPMTLGTEIKRTEFIRALISLGAMAGNLDSVANAFVRFWKIQFGVRMVKETYHPNEVEHTIRLANRNLGGSVVAGLMFHAEVERLKRSGFIDPEKGFGESSEIFQNLELVSWLADMAYGDPYDRVRAAQDNEASGRITLQLIEFNSWMQAIWREIVRVRTNDLFEPRLMLVQTKAGRIREAAKYHLNRWFVENAGQNMKEVHPGLGKILEEAGQATYIDREAIALAASVWRERYVHPDLYR
ncbi:hypothetical protein HY988_02185 [Candidatus Micrarchaeota archaeon]|nr:hypothetical protein [Candidatus Micrarchaeota archaeon]